MATQRVMRRATKLCLTCGRAVTRFRSQFKSRVRVFCNATCKAAYRLPEVACAWPDCTEVLQSRSYQRANGFFTYRIRGGSNDYCRYPICRTHRAKVSAAFGPTYRLGSFARWFLADPNRVKESRTFSSRALRFFVFDRAGAACESCQATLLFTVTRGWQIDHRVPRFRGGLTIVSNAQLLCRRCHDEKSSVEKSEVARLRHAGQRATQRWLTHTEKDRLIAELLAECDRLRAMADTKVPTS